MSPVDFKSQRADKERARKLIAEIVNCQPNHVFFSRHSERELQSDGLTQVDAWNVLKSKDSRIYQDGEFENGSYRYRLETNNILLVVVFQPNGKGLVIVTAWDKRKKRRH